MTSTAKTAFPIDFPGDHVRIHVDSAGRPGLSIYNDSRLAASVRVPHADFLDAIRTELNVIVIDKAELPEVTLTGGGDLTVPVAHGFEVRRHNVNTENLRKRAYALIAIAEYAEANPPADPKVTEATFALTDVGAGHDDGVDTPEGIAEALIKAGYKITKDPS